jgi:uncharacterized cupin superfamily protein
MPAMPNSRFLAFDLTGLAPETGAPPAERRVSGQPVTRTWNLDESEDGKGFSGVWEATPGAWRVIYDEWEFCQILSGVSILHEDGGDPRTVRAGDSFILRPGFTGVWEVVETTRKAYVIRLP